MWQQGAFPPAQQWTTDREGTGLGKKRKREATLLLVLKSFSEILYVQFLHFLSPCPTRHTVQITPSLTLFVPALPPPPPPVSAHDWRSTRMLLLELRPPQAPLTAGDGGGAGPTHRGPHSRSQGKAGSLQGRGTTNCKQRAWQQYWFVEAKNQVKSFQNLNYYL